MAIEVKLREISLSDAEEVAERADDYDIAKMVATMPHPYTIEDGYAWIRRMAGDREKGKGHSLVIDIDGSLAGSIGWFYNEDKELEIGYWVARDFWGLGVASMAVELMIDVIKNECDDNELLGQFVNENPASARVLEKCGFKPDGATKGGCYSLARDEALPSTRMIRKL